MLILLSLILTCSGWYWINRKVRHMQRRKCVGSALIAAGAGATLIFEYHLRDILLWGFVALWCLGLELFFNRDKYRDEY